MNFYAYDAEGFLIGEVADEGIRTTTIAPPVQSPGASKEWCFADHRGEWIAAVRPAVQVGVPDTNGTKITKLAFRQRIGQAALVAIEMAAIHNPNGTVPQQQLAASLRVMLEDVRVATFIDLARPDTRAGVQSLEAAGLLPAGKAAQILDAPVQPAEVPQA